MNGRTFERVGAWCGVAFVVLLLATFFMPSTPQLGASVDEVRQNVADGRTGHLLSAYLGALAVIPFLIFVVALWHRLRDREADRGSFSFVALAGGLLLSAAVLLTTGIYTALVYGADAAEAATVSTLATLDGTFWIAIPFAAATMMTGVAVSALATRALPRWLAWLAAAVASFFIVGALSIFNLTSETNVFGFLVWFGGFFGLLIWTLATSIVMLRAVGFTMHRAGTMRPTAQPT
jgi:hypothetical protein